MNSGRNPDDEQEAMPADAIGSTGMTGQPASATVPESPVVPGAVAFETAPVLSGERFLDPKAIGLHDDGVVALLVRVNVPDQPGVLHALTRVIFEHRANITYVDISERRAQGIAT